MTKREIVALQQSLNRSGFAYQVLGEALKEDGIYGPATDRVHRAWLDQDTAIPTLTPEPVKPWWTHKARLYEILAEVEAGTRPVPLSLADIEADLPALAWAD